MGKNIICLPKGPRLKDFQIYVDRVVKERGFEKETISEIFNLFFEECGEMVKAARKNIGIKSDRGSTEYRIDEEIADVFIYLLDICNHFHIDLEQAFRNKEEVNKKRKWE